MKRIAKGVIATVLVALSLSITGCADSLERIVDEHHQQRLDEANAERPIGARDAVGMSATSQTQQLTVTSTNSEP